MRKILQTIWDCYITEKRNRQVKDAINKAARLVLNHCLENRIGTVVFGWNQGQRQEINLGSKTNQKFVQIPTAKLKDRIAQLCQQYGLRFVETEESYTSKASFLDSDELPTFGEKPEGWQESGKRVQRGLYRAGDGSRINADCNGAANIIRKVAVKLGLDLSGISRGAGNCTFENPIMGCSRIPVPLGLGSIKFYSEDSGYTVARLKVGGASDLLTIVGNFANIQPGQTLKLRGTWREHPQYGPQFQVAEQVLDESCPSLRPNNLRSTTTKVQKALLTKLITTPCFKNTRHKNRHPLSKNVNNSSFSVALFSLACKFVDMLRYRFAAGSLFV